MLIQQETRSIPVHVIDLGNRRQLPSPTEVNQMVSSIKEDGLLAPIGVQRTGENSYHLVHGATRLLAVKELGWLEVPAIIFDGTAEDSASAEIVENLTRRHLDKDQRDELTRAYVALRAEQKQNDPAKEFNDSSSPISCDAPNTHPKTNTEGRKRGRPPTPRGQSKKEVAAATGQSLRNVQRVTSAKPKSGSAPSKTSADRDTIRLE